MQVSCASPLAVGSFVWQPRAGAFALTVVCKATYTLQQGVSPLVATPDEPSFTDIHWQGNPAASVHIPSDLAPFKRRIDVLVSGHVHAPVGPPVRSLVARLRVGTIQKSMAVLGDRFWTPDGRISGPAPFTKMPILWERAEGGRGTWNPVGIPVGLPAGREGPAPLPSFEPVGFVRQTPTQGSMPVGLGPLSPAWPTRTMYLRHHRATWSHDTWYRAPLPADIDPAYFNSAAPDQQLDRLPDWIPIYLENLHPEAPNLGTVLEDIRPRALVTRTTAAPMEIWLRCDTLLIDTDRGTCTLTWRASVPIAGPFEKGMVHVTMTRGSFADAVPGGAPPAEVPVHAFPEAPVHPFPEEPAEEAPVETARRLEIEDEETTSMVAKAGLVVARGPLLLRYAPPAPASIADGERSPSPSPAPAFVPAGVDTAEEVEEVDAEEVEEVDAEEADVEEVATGDLDIEEVPTGRVRFGEAATGEVDIEDEETRTSVPEDAPQALLPSPPAPGLPAAPRDGEVARTPFVRPATEEYLPSPGPAMPSPSMGAPFPSAGATLESPGAAFQSPGLPPPSLEGPSRPPTLPLAPSGGPSRPPTLQLPPTANPSRPRTLPFARAEASSPPPAGSFQSSSALPFQWPAGSFQSSPALPFQSPAGSFQSSPGSFQSSPVPARSPAEALPSPAPRGAFDEEETHTGYSEVAPPVSLPFPKAGAERGAPAHGSGRPAPRAMPRPFGASFDDDVTHTGEGVEVAVEPLPFQSAAPLPRALAPSMPSPPAPPLDGSPPWAPLVALASPEASSPPLTSLADHVPAHAREEPARPQPPGITLEQYARVKSELWGSEASLPEALAWHGIDEIAWRVHERWQADALAAEAREGRCDLALALVAAFESARAVPAEVPFAVVSASDAT